MVWTLRVESPQYVASFCDGVWQMRTLSGIMIGLILLLYIYWRCGAVSCARCWLECVRLCNEPSRYAISHSQFWCSSEHRDVSPIWLIRYADSLTDASGADSSNADGGLWRRLLAGGLVPMCHWQFRWNMGISVTWCGYGGGLPHPTLDAPRHCAFVCYARSVILLCASTSASRSEYNDLRAQVHTRTHTWFDIWAMRYKSTLFLYSIHYIMWAMCKWPIFMTVYAWRSGTFYRHLQRVGVCASARACVNDATSVCALDK